eukprot:TCONS_00066707-protein
MSGCDWKSEIREKVHQIFVSEPETFARILFYLDEEEKAYDDTDKSPVWKTLRVAAKAVTTFEAYARRLADDTKRAEKDESFRLVMQKMYALFSEPSENGQSVSMELVPSENRIAAIFPGMAIVWDMVGPEGQKKLLPVILKVCGKFGGRELVAVTDELASLITKNGGALVAVALAAVYLTIDAILNIRKWWLGEISGKRCAKSIIDTAGAVTGAIGGGAGGAALGSFAGPIGAFAGSLIGSLLGNFVALSLIEKLTEFLFDLPRDVAVEKSYDYLGVTRSSSNNDVNRAFRNLCLKHHPDKGGDVSEFITLQSHMAIIKQARGEL